MLKRLLSKTVCFFIKRITTHPDLTDYIVRLTYILTVRYSMQIQEIMRVLFWYADGPTLLPWILHFPLHYANFMLNVIYFMLEYILHAVFIGLLLMGCVKQLRQEGGGDSKMLSYILVNWTEVHSICVNHNNVCSLWLVITNYS